MKYCIVNIDGESRYQDDLNNVVEGERIFELNPDTGSYEEIFIS